MKRFHQQLTEVRKRTFYHDRLKREITQLIKELENLKEQEQQFLHILDQEEEDVEKLERVSFTNLFATLSGNKVERVEEEEREVVEARLKWREAHHSVQEVEQELQRLREQLNRLGDPDKDYERLLQQKKTFLIEQGEAQGQRLLELSENRSEVLAEIEEINEALSAGKRAVTALGEASISLDSAENWGTLDMLGGGMLTTAVKHSRVDDANSAVHSAQRHLRKFAREIDDLGTYYNHRVEISGGLTIADYFLDGLIVDWFVQNRIQTSQDEVRKIRSKTHAVIMDLESLREQFVGEQKKLEDEQRRILEPSI
ncbi:hypothetical protein [Halobacillus mangrovi]|uniref:Uncharacterized protein n=1 Tax=Halobacillus mangrovi TaxID=402384 RepID=A0A1W5ZXV9_9BACI|nr:hypothetical protein [Halobacillus mangrovi]ARI78077.1 hypothetical protein HM131_14995 [Halobacillus mangrovi]